MIRKTFIYFSLALILLISPFHLYAMGTPPPHKHVPLRILVTEDAENVSLRIKGAHRIVDFQTGEVLEQDRKSRRFTVSTENIGADGIKILPAGKTRIYIDGRQFRGEIDIIKSENGKLFVVNHIDLEEYLYGVLYHEVSHRWPIEVLKAQAVAARTYALYQKLVSKNKYFELTSDIYSQVYGGRTSERWRTNKAVNLTVGRVLTYDGKVFPSYYHATCGGYTSDASTIWNIDVPALHGKACDFCRISPHYNWKKELKIGYIQDRLSEAGYKIQVISFEVLTRDESGRVLDIMLKGGNGNLTLSGNKFRLLIGPNIIRSTNFEVSTRGKFITFQGKGWGHGVGMCQWGAYHMARKGWNADQILGYYYPGAEILRLE